MKPAHNRAPANWRAANLSSMADSVPSTARYRADHVPLATWETQCRRARTHSAAIGVMTTSCTARSLLCSTGLRSILRSCEDAPAFAGRESATRWPSIWRRTECLRWTSSRQFLQSASALPNEAISLLEDPVQVPGPRYAGLITAGPPPRRGTRPSFRSRDSSESCVG
jgi:hypothetical protein